jgi:hypothetical protein
MASRTDSEEVPESREFPASGRQGVEVMDFERAGRAAGLAAPPRSVEDAAPKSLPWPAPPAPVLLAVRVSRARQAGTAAHSARPESAHGRSVADG